MWYLYFVKLGAGPEPKRPILPLLDDEAVARFWSVVEKTPSCWLWTRSLNNKGYGQFYFSGVPAPFLAHRVSFVIKHRTEPPPGRALILHSCDNPRCVRPSHLSIGSQRKNIREAHARGRFDGRRSFYDVERLTELQRLHNHGFSINWLSRWYACERETVRRALHRASDHPIEI